MKKAFTLIELLVVIAIIAILAALLMPALDRAKKQAEKTSCLASVHNVGLGIAMFLADHENNYPGWVSDGVNSTGEAWFWSGRKGAHGTDGDPYYQLINQGYMRDVDLFDCPGAANPQRGNWYGPEIVPAGPQGSKVHEGRKDGTEKYVMFSEYSYDLLRIARASVAGRVIYGDSWERVHNWMQEQYWAYNHSDGSNILYIDNGAEFSELQNSEDEWQVQSAPSVTGNAPWRRWGWIPNPRMDEDAHRASAYMAIPGGSFYMDGTSFSGNADDLLYPRDRDDVYAIEGWNSWGYCEVDNWSWAGNPTDKINGASTSDANSSRIRKYTVDGTLELEPGTWWGRDRSYSWWQSRNAGWFPEVGEFANELRWDTHDARLVGIGACEIVPDAWRP